MNNFKSMNQIGQDAIRGDLPFPAALAVWAAANGLKLTEVGPLVGLKPGAASSAKHDPRRNSGSVRRIQRLMDTGQVEPEGEACGAEISSAAPVECGKSA